MGGREVPSRTSLLARLLLVDIYDLPCAVKGYAWAFLWAVLKIAQYAKSDNSENRVSCMPSSLYTPLTVCNKYASCIKINMQAFNQRRSDRRGAAQVISL